MAILSKGQVASRERTLLTAFLLSAPGPLVTGIAVFSSHSTTQLADFLRRTVELVALFISWWVFRQLHQNRESDAITQAKLELAAGLSVGGTMMCTGIVMLMVTISRMSAFEPSGDVKFGLTIAVLGLMFNSMFWWRYMVLTREQFSFVIAAQRDLYRTKAFVDFCVVTALAAVAIFPNQPVTHYVDTLGSVIVAAYLLLSGIRATQTHFAQSKGLSRNLEK